MQSALGGQNIWNQQEKKYNYAESEPLKAEREGGKERESERANSILMEGGGEESMMTLRLGLTHTI